MQTLSPRTIRARLTFLDRYISELRDETYRLADQILADPTAGEHLAAELDAVIGELRLAAAILDADDAR